MKKVLLLGAVAIWGLPGADPQLPVPSRLSLPQAEQLLMQRNQLVAASRYQLEVSQALRRIAGYRPNPVLHIGAEQVPYVSNISGSTPRFFATNPDAGSNPVYTAQLNYTFERGGKRELRARQADAVIDASQAQILETFRTQLFQLRQAFTAAVLARENLKLAEAIDREYGETERLTLVRVNSGDLAGVEVSRVRAGRLPYRQAILDAQAAYQQASRDILNVLNVQPGDRAAAAAGADLEILGALSEDPVSQTPAELRERALRDRPDVAVARNSARAAEAGVGLAEAQRKRDVAFGFEYQRVGQDHSAGITAEVPLFIYNNQKAAIAQSVAQRHVAEAQLRQVETQALTDVEKAYQAYLTAQKALSIYSRDGMAEAARVREVVAYSYRRGEASLFELLDAQRTASQAAIAANQARFNYQMSLWQLQNAIGGSLR